VLYNKFNVDGSSPPNNPPPHPNTGYSCVVATTDHWELARCDEQHRVVCQSDTLTIAPISNMLFTIIAYISSVSLILIFSSISPTMARCQVLSKLSQPILLAMGLCPSVRLSVSVCLSQVGVLLKRLNVGSHKQHHTRAQGL